MIKYRLNAFVCKAPHVPRMRRYLFVKTKYNTGNAYFRQYRKSNLIISLIAIRRGVGIGHGNKSRFQCRLYIIFAECHARSQAEFFHQLRRRHGISFDNGHQSFYLIADMALMAARISCKFGDRLFDNTEHEQDKAV